MRGEQSPRKGEGKRFYNENEAASISKFVSLSMSIEMFVQVCSALDW